MRIGALGLFILLALPGAADPPDCQSPFAAGLKRLGQYSPAQFREHYQRHDLLPGIKWDPTTARYWKEFNQAPPPAKAGHMTRPDFRLNPEELRQFKAQGFVVSERLGKDSMTGLLYRIYNADLPIFISADCILHAWHESFNEACAEWELCDLAPRLEQVLGAMHAALPGAARDYGPGPLAESARDADFFLTVALSLLRGTTVSSQLSQDGRVRDTLALCQAQLATETALFGVPRRVDFSRLKVRGRYERYKQLQGYFRAVVWCSLAGLRLTDDGNADRELSTVWILADLLNRSGKLETWTQFEQTIDGMVGGTDGLSLGQAQRLLGRRLPGEWKAAEDELRRGRLGIEQIPSYEFVDPHGPARQPRMFFVSGARFTLDSWALSQTVYSRVHWQGKSVQRRMPSALDVAFAVLGNNAVVPELYRRLTSGGQRFRDGLNYQHNLAAARIALDSLPATLWEASPATLWLACLRELSTPADPRAPESMRTQAWAMRLTNTQLASWAQLRHDTLLDAKSSETSGTLCSYPAGYVEPRPAFWGRMEKMARAAAAHPRSGRFFADFADQMAVLQGIAEKELAGQPLTPEQAKFLQSTVEVREGHSGGMGYTGWYFRLFYKGLSSRDEPELWEPTVADVHTAAPDPITGDPGGILLQGTGAADMMIVAVDNGPDRMVYAGPTMSYYEWISPTRMSDSEWKENVESGQTPDRPGWTRPYLVPSRW